MIPQGFLEIQRLTAGETVFLFGFLQLEAAGGGVGWCWFTSAIILPAP